MRYLRCGHQGTASLAPCHRRPTAAPYERESALLGRGTPSRGAPRPGSRAPGWHPARPFNGRGSAMRLLNTGQIRSEWPIAFDRHAPARARLRVIVPECLVLDAAVVPEGDRMLLPAEADLEFLARAVLAQELENRAALLVRQPIDVGGEMTVDE